MVTICVKDMNIAYMNGKIHIFVKWLNIDEFNSQSHYLEYLLIARKSFNSYYYCDLRSFLLLLLNLLNWYKIC